MRAALKHAQVYDFKDYKSFLSAALPAKGDGRGLRTQLALALKCQSTFISQVLNGENHFSLEHIVKISEFLGLTEQELNFLLLLTQKDRAGSLKLAQHFQKQIDAILEKRNKIRERLNVSNHLSLEAKTRYYSSWHYTAIHVLTSIPETQTRESISSCLNIPLSVVTECLDFLVAHKLVREEDGLFRIGDARIHVGADSSLVSKHHINWRLQALNSLDRLENNRNKDLHYSGAISVSREDALRIREILLRSIEACEQVFRPSPEEKACGIAIDFFELGRWGH